MPSASFARRWIALLAPLIALALSACTTDYRPFRDDYTPWTQADEDCLRASRAADTSLGNPDRGRLEMARRYRRCMIIQGWRADR